jgi:serine/threonine protein kinase
MESVEVGDQERRSGRGALAPIVPVPALPPLPSPLVRPAAGGGAGFKAPLTRMVCTPCYRAPEVVMSRGVYTQAIDMWWVLMSRGVYTQAIDMWWVLMTQRKARRGGRCTIPACRPPFCGGRG